MQAGFRCSLAAGLALSALTGCYVPKSQITAIQTENHVLAEQNRAQLVEIENLKAHSRQTEDELNRAEQHAAGLQQKADQTGQQGQFRGMSSGLPLPPAVSRQLASLAQQYPGMQLDPVTGAGKLDVDVLFDSGKDELKPAARDMLVSLSQVLQLDEAKDLKIMIVGHTDNQRITGRPTREKFANNFHLSTGRALQVADLLRAEGLADRRIGVAGFGTNEPVASNDVPGDRQRNRRVEIYVMAPDVPVVGWTDSNLGRY